MGEGLETYEMITLGAQNKESTGVWNRARSMQHWSPDGRLVEQTSVFGERRVSVDAAIDHTGQPVPLDGDDTTRLANADALKPLDISVRNPRTGLKDYVFTPLSRSGVFEVCHRLRGGQPHWCEAGFDTRADCMKEWSQMLVASRQELLKALTLDTGRLTLTLTLALALTPMLDTGRVPESEIEIDAVLGDSCSVTTVPNLNCMERAESHVNSCVSAMTACVLCRCDTTLGSPGHCSAAFPSRGDCGTPPAFRKHMARVRTLSARGGHLAVELSALTRLHRRHPGASCGL